jgi:hypothetical protein
MLQAEVRKGPARLRYVAAGRNGEALYAGGTDTIWQMRSLSVMACSIGHFARLRDMC